GLLMVQCQLSRVATITYHLLAMASDVEIRAVEIIVTYPPTIKAGTEVSGKVRNLKSNEKLH
ncbi:MAG: hypothetical protein ACJ8BW_17185, partial [Ktedonobacteraceae bacterium]